MSTPSAGGSVEPAAEPSAWNLPNALTVLRILMVPVFGWMLLAHPDQAGWRWATTGVFIVAMATDYLDGYLARSRSLVTSFGKLMDPIADKALTGMAFIGLSIIGELWWWVTIVILLREWGITVMRFFILKYGVMAANRGGKLKTMTQSIAVPLYLLPLPSPATGLSIGSGLEVVSWVAMAAALLLTVLTGLEYLREAARLRVDYRRTHPEEG